jgi:hypothetical protein
MSSGSVPAYSSREMAAVLGQLRAATHRAERAEADLAAAEATIDRADTHTAMLAERLEQAEAQRLQAIREALEARRDDGRTHFDGCERLHRDCAIACLLTALTECQQAHQQAEAEARALRETLQPLIQEMVDRAHYDSNITRRAHELIIDWAKRLSALGGSATPPKVERCGKFFGPVVAPAHCSRNKGHEGACGWGEPYQSATPPPPSQEG